MDIAIKIIQAAVSLVSVIIAAIAAKRAIQSGREQALNTKLDRWQRDYATLVRDPMLPRFAEVAKTVAQIVEQAIIQLQVGRHGHAADPADEVIRRHAEAVQLQIVDLREVVLGLARAADEHELVERLSRKLEQTEDELIELLAGLEVAADVVDHGEILRAAKRQFVPLHRTVIQYGREARSRLERTPLKRSPAAATTA